jgi:tetratricopeptide (TPR) repeat protein
MYLRYGITIALTGVLSVLSAQKKGDYQRQALAAFHIRNYESALDLGERAIGLGASGVSMYFITGESARRLQQWESAAKSLGKIKDQAKYGAFSVTDYLLGNVMFHLGKYEDARRCYLRYTRNYLPEDNPLARLAIAELNRVASIGIGEYRSFSPEVEKLDLPDIGPIALAPVEYAGRVYFTSFGKTDSASPSVGRIYETSDRHNVRALDFGNKDQQPHTGNVAVMPDASRMYYTLCKDEDFATQNQCEIWYRNRKYEGGWDIPKRLPKSINKEGFTATQPTVGWDKSLKKFVLFFASDRPGGKGKRDIWGVAIEWDGVFGEPFPLPFNTVENDGTPFFHQGSQTLFFSSDGLPGNGGFDIYRTTKLENGDWTTPENLGEVFNSPADDLYYSFNAKSGKALFSSNRSPKNCGHETAACDCMEIYSASIFTGLTLTALDETGSVSLHNARVEVQDVAADESAFIGATNDADQWHIKLLPGKLYRVVVSEKGFESAVFEVDTAPNSFFTTLEKRVALKRRR